MNKLASHEYHASKPIPPEAKRKYGLKKERREYESEKPVPEDVAEDLGLEKEHHKEAEAAFMGALLSKLAMPLPPISSPAYRTGNQSGGSSGRRSGGRSNAGPDRDFGGRSGRGESRQRSYGSDREDRRESRGLSVDDVERIVDMVSRKNKSKDKKQSRGLSAEQEAQMAPQLPQEILINLPSSSGPSALGRMTTFGGAGALANLLLGDESKSKQERAVKGALIGAGLGGLYHLLRK
ncbi:MAG: hypothetical protein EBU84_00305, partial [Actinobacteria bacterium]|nr:hypothetical protein [Actinomycetota bacterium]